MEYKILTETEFKDLNIKLDHGIYSEEYFCFVKDYYSAVLHFLLFEENGKILVILPLASYRQKNILVLGTLPKTDVSLEYIRPFIVDYSLVIDLLKKHFSKHQIIDLRIFSYNKGESMKGLKKMPIYHSVAKIDKDDLFSFFDKKTRNQVRQSLAHNFEARMDTELESVYELYLENMKRHGTPPKSLDYFESLKINLKGKIFFLTAFLGDALCGASIFYMNNDYLLLISNLSYKDYWPSRINNFLYFKTIEYGYKNGVKYFDYGPSTEKDKSHLDFKIGFGGCLFSVYGCSLHRNLFVKLGLYLMNKSRNIKMRIMRLLSKK